VSALALLERAKALTTNDKQERAKALTTNDKNAVFKIHEPACS
jgi:hypothetical protein